LMQAEALDAMAHVLAAQGQAILATRLLAASAALRAQMGTPVRPVDRPSLEQALAAARSSLGTAAFAAEWAVAQALPLAQVLKLVPSEAVFATLCE
jgi:hypothetical protein